MKLVFEVGAKSYEEVQAVIAEIKQKTNAKLLKIYMLDEEIIPFMLEIYKKDKNKFDLICEIMKTVDNITKDKDFLLELCVTENKHLSRYNELLSFFKKIKDISEKKNYKTIYNYLSYINKKKFDNILLLKEKINYVDVENQSFFHSLIVEYITNPGFDFSNFDVFFEEENEEEDNDNITDEGDTTVKGTSGLAGYNGKEVINKLKKLGFEHKKVNGKKQGKGDHVLLKNGQTGKIVLVPMRKMRASTLRDTLVRAGVSKEEFLDI